MWYLSGSFIENGGQDLADVTSEGVVDCFCEEREKIGDERLVLYLIYYDFVDDLLQFDGLHLFRWRLDEFSKLIIFFSFLDFNLYLL